MVVDTTRSYSNFGSVSASMSLNSKFAVSTANRYILDGWLTGISQKGRQTDRQTDRQTNEQICFSYCPSAITAMNATIE